MLQSSVITCQFKCAVTENAQGSHHVISEEQPLVNERMVSESDPLCKACSRFNNKDAVEERNNETPTLLLCSQTRTVHTYSYNASV